MKNLKKVFALLLAVLMVAALGTAAFADDDKDILAGHTYTAYQIFKGTQTADETEGKLADIEWGDGVDGAALLTALQKETAYKDCKSAAAVAEVLSANLDDSDAAKAFAKIAEKHIVSSKGIAVENGQTTLNAGYYLVVDTTSGDVDQYNLSLLQLTKKGTFEIKTKVSVPSSDKVIVEDTVEYVEDEDGTYYLVDGEYTETAPDDADDDTPTYKKVEGTKDVDASTAGIGDTVTYKITANIPAEAVDYDYYYFIINDTMDPGLTYAGITSVEASKTGDLAGKYTLLTGDDAGDCTFKIALTDAKALAGETVTVLCTATVNENASIGTTDPNTNTENVTYSNKPSFEYDGTNISGKPGVPDSTKNVPTGETPDNTVDTYVTKLTIHKVDENGKVLTGAEFQLTGDTTKVIVTTGFEFKPADDGTYYKLADDKGYTTEEPVTEAYMEAAAADATEGYVIDNDAADTVEGLIVIGGVTYRPFVAEDDAGKDVYILVEVNTDEYDADDLKDGVMYAKVPTTEVMGSGESKTDIKAEVDENGNVSFTGLGAGKYTIKETKTPAGYNSISDIDFEITFDAKELAFASDNTSITLGADNGFETTIVNNAGTTLPETGGIGTTIFYIVGGLLLAGAVVLLITKKRMSAENE